MAMNNTNNPVGEDGSSDPRDLQDNAKVLDLLINGTAEEVTSRLGISLDTYQMLVKKLQASGGMLSFSDADTLLAFTPATANVLAQDSSTGEQYFWNGEKWTKSVYNPDLSVRNLISEYSDSSAYSFSAGPSVSRLNETIFADQQSKMVFSFVQTGDLSRYSPLYLSLNAGQALLKRIPLPPASVYSGGILQTYFKKTSFENLEFNEVAERTTTTVRVRYSLPAELSFTPDQYMYQVLDLSGVFDSGNQSTISAQTTLTISSHSTQGMIQFLIPVSVITSAGLDATKDADVVKYLGSVMSGQAFLVYSDAASTFQSYSDLSRYFEVISGAGSYSVTTNDTNNGVSFTLDRYIKKPVSFSRRGFLSRYIADIKNEASVDYKNYPMELRVKLPQSVAFSSDELTLTDSAGTEYPCQFAGESHVNLRKGADMGVYGDGSLSCGSVIFNSDLLSGGQKYLELTVQGINKKKQALSSRAALKKVSASELSVTVGDITCYFDRGYGNHLSKVIKNGVDLNIQHRTYMTVLPGGVATNQLFMRSASVEVVNSGDIFTDVQVKAYNFDAATSTGSLAKDSLESVTTYRIFNSGQIRIYTVIRALKQIPVSQLYGIFTSMPVRFASGYQSNYQTKVITYSGTSASFSLSLIHQVTDTHRDGTAYGADRPFYNTMTVNNATNGVFEFGWRYASASDYSFLNWPVDKDWAWSSEMWVDLNESLTDLTKIAARASNRPVGFLGEGIWKGAGKRELIESSLLLGKEIYEFLDTTEANGIGGSSGKPDHRRQWNPYPMEIISLREGGSRTLSDIYADFKYRQQASYSVTDITKIGEQYTSGKLPLQWASSDTVISMQWIFLQAEKEGNTSITDEIKLSLVNMCDALIAAAGKQAVNIPPLDGTFNNWKPASNAGAIAMRFLSLAIYAGADTDNKYLSFFTNIESILSTNYITVENMLGDGYDNRPDHDLWLSYSLWTSYFYVSSCELIGRTPVASITSISTLLFAMAGQGALRDIDFNMSESRRGKTIHWFNAIYLGLWSDRVSTVNAAKSLYENTFRREWGPQPGYPGRFCGFLENTVNGPVPKSDVPFLVNYISDCYLSWLRKRGKF